MGIKRHIFYQFNLIFQKKNYRQFTGILIFIVQLPVNKKVSKFTIPSAKRTE